MEIPGVEAKYILFLVCFLLNVTSSDSVTGIS